MTVRKEVEQGMDDSDADRIMSAIDVLKEFGIRE